MNSDITTLERAERAVRGIPIQPQAAPSRRDLLRSAPSMPGSFYGSVVFRYAAGKLTLAEVTETLRPEGA